MDKEPDAEVVVPQEPLMPPKTSPALLAVEKILRTTRGWGLAGGEMSEEARASLGSCSASALVPYPPSALMQVTVWDAAGSSHGISPIPHPHSVAEHWGLAASGRHMVQLKTYPFPSCPLASSPPSLPPSLTLPFSFCLSPSLVFTHSLSGRAASEGPAQRSVAATQTGTAGSCNSEWILTCGGLCHWGME